MNNKKLVIGALAHVDAGKTTLSESILYLSGSIRKLGRVDHKNAFLDTYELERARGITIFSKQARFILGDVEVTLLDTPGHVDFSAEMERSLQVLDYAVLIINGADGVQGHTLTLWKLLEHYHVPAFIFINKMDQNGTDKNALLEELIMKLDERCIDFDNQNQEALFENLAMCDEAVLEQYLEAGSISREKITKLVAERKAFPCYFGSALKLTGVEKFLQGLKQYTRTPDYPDEFGARIFKITRDKQGNRLTHMKITGGSLKVKDFLTNRHNIGNDGIWEEKADQIRIYSGDKYTMPDKVWAGTICTVAGLTKTYSGEGLGTTAASLRPVLEPVLTYQILLPEGCDTHSMLIKLRQIEEEEPLLRIIWEEQLNEIHVKVMGEVEIEILKCMIKERFGVEAEFGFGGLVYKETILKPVAGVGHFEPLCHYAEVHLLLEPQESGSGLQFGTECSEDLLNRNWQRLILSHLEEKKHKGVLTGSEITDMKITLIAGKAHIKHTEGGDFRQAVYRAVRHGLKKAESILLEPVYEFRLEVPAEMAGRALSDIQKMYGKFSLPETAGGISIITGSAPVAAMRDYQMEVTAYSKGHGRLFCTLKGYEPCCNSEEIIAAKGYDSEKDMDNPSSSIFCSHGAGFLVSWENVEKYMHLDSGFKLKEEQHKQYKESNNIPSDKGDSYSLLQEKELEEIFIRTYGQSKRDRNLFRQNADAAGADLKTSFKKSLASQGEVSSIDFISAKAEREYKKEKKEIKEQYLLVDGYNIIFAWEELNELAQMNLDSARYKLMDILCSYQGFTDITLIIVFDAYMVKGNPGNAVKYNNIYVVYTKEAETADQYIEKTVHKIGRKHNVTVATSDALEQMIIWGDGARRISAQGFKEEIDSVNKEIRASFNPPQGSTKNFPFQVLSENKDKP